MFSSATIIRFVEAFVAVFVVTFAADPIFGGGSVDLSSDGIRAIGVAVVSAAVIAIRRAVAAKS